MRFILIIILCFISVFCKSQNLQFYREDITFTISNGYFYVDGIYNFCNNGDSEINKVLFYPFPDEVLPENIDSVFAIDVFDQNKSVLNQTKNNGLFFEVNIDAYGTGKYNVGYRQKITENIIEYILLTTKEWKIPFDNAYYKLIVQDKYKIRSLSYEADSVTIIQGDSVYYWNKTDFMPDNNFIIEIGK